MYITYITYLSVISTLINTLHNILQLQLPTAYICHVKFLWLYALLVVRVLLISFTFNK
jgi:hypothetical protein